MAAVYQDTTASSNVALGAALRRHWFVTLLAVALLVGASVVLGLKRTPRYTAQASVSIGQVYFNNPAGISSVVQGTQSLATVYSRAIDADAVQHDTAKRLGWRSLPPSVALSATPVPESPLITVKAIASSARGAVDLANSASAALVAYVKEQGRYDEQAAALAARYRRAALQYRRRLVVQDRLTKQREANPTPANTAAFNRAIAAADTARLRRDALLSSYQSAVAGVYGSPPVQVFASSTEAGSDRYQILEILLIGGLVGGLAAGAALSLLLELRKARHASRS